MELKTRVGRYAVAGRSHASAASEVYERNLNPFLAVDWNSHTTRASDNVNGMSYHVVRTHPNIVRLTCHHGERNMT